MSLILNAAVAMMLAAPSPAEVHKSADKVVDSSYQKSLPGESPVAGDGGTRGKAGGDRQIVDQWWKKKQKQPGRYRSEDDRTAVPAGGAISTLASALMWVVIIVVVALLAYLMVQELSGYTHDEAAGEGDDGGEDGKREVDDAVVIRPLGDAEALATQGRFGEAIHVLLLHTLEELARRVSIKLPRSMTSREILRRVAIPDQARVALADLVTAVEVSHFGGATPSEADYHMCRDRFHRFAEAYTRGQA